MEHIVIRLAVINVKEYKEKRYNLIYEYFFSNKKLFKKRIAN